jgi:hypothetical protein
MSESKHTPWTYHLGEDYTEFYNANGDIICHANYRMDEADARLIAAAPELLEALKAVLQYCVTVDGVPDKGKGRTITQQKSLDLARTAIAKAEQ